VGAVTAASDPTPLAARAQQAEDGSAVDVLDTPEAGARVIRGGALLSASYFAGMLLTAVSVPFMTRGLGVDDFGLFVTASSAVMIIAGVSEAGLSGIGTREYVVADPGTRRRMLANLLGLRIALTVTGLVVGCAIMVALGYDDLIVTGVGIVGVGLLLTLFQDNWTVPLAGSLRWGWFSLLGFLRASVTAILVIGFALLGAGVMEYFLISIIAAATVFGLTAWKMRGHVEWLPGFERAEWLRFLRDALPYAAATTVGVLYFRVALMMLSLDSTKEQTSYYSAAFKIVEVFGGLSGMIVVSAFPVLARAARDDIERLRYGLGKVLQTTVMVGSWFALSLYVGAPLAIDVVAGSQFEPAVGVLRIQAPAMIAGFAVAALGYALLSLREHAALLKGSLVAFGVAVVLSLLLVGTHGAMGAATATLSAEAALLLCYAFFLTRARPELRPSPLVWVRVFVALGPALVVGMLLPVPMLVRLACSSAVYFGVLALVGGVPNELWSTFTAFYRSAVRRRPAKS
jgi:O-antigen/teichoic acid export membrane protein